jgi:hypothetical protein
VWKQSPLLQKAQTVHVHRLSITEPKEISILAWNLNGFNDNSPDYFIDDLANYFSRFDIICAVEIPATTCSQALSNLIFQLNNIVVSSLAYSPYRTGQNLCIARMSYKVTLSEITVEEEEEGNKSKRKKKKRTAGLFTIEIDGNPLNLLTVHLKSESNGLFLFFVFNSWSNSKERRGRRRIKKEKRGRKRRRGRRRIKKEKEKEKEKGKEQFRNTK